MAREATAFDQIAGGRPIVLFGAGGLGRKTLRALRRAGIEPLAFADNASPLWGKAVLDVPVLEPKEAAARYGSTAAFIVTIWGGEGRDRMGTRLAFLKDLGCECALSFGPLFWKYPDDLFPHYAAGPAHEVHDQADAVLEAGELWNDEASVREYISQVRWRLHFDFDALAAPAPHPMYFPADLCTVRPDEVFVDCGAFDGDTIASFLRQAKSGFRKIIAFEPDPANYEKLAASVSELEDRSRIELKKSATGAENGTVRFSADGNSSSAVSSGSLEVECVRLDDVLAEEAPSYIKMDIEGAEPDTLLGARRVIAKNRPVLAICCYHRQDHLWKIPRMIHAIDPDYCFFLRPHFADVWDLVCYAIPPERIVT
jgi:FkbM family methyltransferase